MGSWSAAKRLGTAVTHIHPLVSILKEKHMSEDSTKQTDKKSGGTRSKVLFAILALGLVALAYDYRVARPAVEVAYNKIAERSTAVNAKSTEVFTNLDVRELLGMEPSRTFDDTNGDVVEVFSWRSGLPIKTHDLFAIYKPNGGKNLFYRHAKYKYESSGDVSTISVLTTIDSVGGEGDFDEAAYELETGSGGGGGQAAGDDNGGGGPGGGRGGGGGWNPEAMFAENDADGDGILKGEELSDRMRENLAEIDTDGDGGVSKDEMMARFAARGGGGRPGGGGGGDAGRRSPPESEDAQPARDGDSSVAYQEVMKAKAESDAKAESEAEPESQAEPEAKAETEPQAKNKSEGDEA